MDTTLWKELSDNLAEGAAGGAGWNGPYEGEEYWFDNNGNGSCLDEFFQYSYYTQNASNLKKVQQDPSAYLTETDYTDPYGSYCIIKFKYEEQRPRQSTVSSKIRFIPLSA